MGKIHALTNTELKTTKKSGGNQWVDIYYVLSNKIYYNACILTSWNIRKRNGNASFTAEVFSLSASFEHNVRRQSSNTSNMTDPTFPFLMNLKYTNLPHSDWESRLVTE